MTELTAEQQELRNLEESIVQQQQQKEKDAAALLDLDAEVKRLTILKVCNLSAMMELLYQWTWFMIPGTLIVSVLGGSL